MNPGERVLDLGCWPGGWMQVAAERVGPTGRVVGVDIAETAPLSNANSIAIQGDLTEPTVLKRILSELGTPADLLLCDAAPKLTGVRAVDRAREAALLEAVEAQLDALLRPGGALVLKLLDAPEAEAVSRRLAGRFGRARTVRLGASRRGTRERYFVAKEFRGSFDPLQPSNASR